MSPALPVELAPVIEILPSASVVVSNETGPEVAVRVLPPATKVLAESKVEPLVRVTLTLMPAIFTVVEPARAFEVKVTLPVYFARTSPVVSELAEAVTATASTASTEVTVPFAGVTALLAEPSLTAPATEPNYA